MLWSISSFWLSAFRVPKACIREIDKICSAFLWSGCDLNPRKSKIAWEDICRPKTEGGLGLRSLQDINKVTCLKLLWRLLTNRTSLWVQWIQTNLLKNESIWSLKEDDKRGSWMWRKILKFRGIARQLCKVDVNNGAATSFWFDNWSPMGCLMDVIGPRGQIDMGIGKNETILTAWTKRRRRQHPSQTLQRIEHNLISLNRRENADVLLWKGKQSRYKPSFTTRDTWNHKERLKQQFHGTTASGSVGLHQNISSVLG